MKITKNTPIGEALFLCPESADVFLEYGMQCVMCHAAAWETIEQGAQSHGMPTKTIQELVKKINTLYIEQESAEELKEETSKPKICLPIQERSQKKIIETFEKYQNSFDLFEVWLDKVIDLNLKELIAKKTKPLICVCKGEEEKGSFRDSEEDRLQILISAAQTGSDFIDIGIHTKPSLIKKFIKNKGDSSLILSSHNWNKTPKLTTILSTVNKMIPFKPDLIKYVSWAENYEDNIQIMRLAENLKKKNFKFITMTMGDAGKFSRIFTPLLGSSWMYAPLKTTSASAAGQISVDDLKIIWEKVC